MRETLLALAALVSAVDAKPMDSPSPEEAVAYPPGDRGRQSATSAQPHKVQKAPRK